MRRVVLLAVAACASPQALGPTGSTVRLRGRLSNAPMEHMMIHVPGKQPAYFDYAPDRQAVIYWASEVACGGELRVTGTVIDATGPSKRGHGTFSERSIDVATAECRE